MKILISRRRGGLGDQICCEVAVRAARQRFPNAHITFATNGDYLPLFYDQKRSKYPCLGPDEVIWPDPFDEVISSFEVESDHHFELDGPEMRHQIATDYNLTESRIESWVNYVDCTPDDLCPRWIPTSGERQEVISWLNEAGIKPFQFILVQWQSAELKKDYPHVEELVQLLKKTELPVVVCHHGTLPELGVFEIINWPFRQLGCLTQLAALSIGPDSFLQHFSAAVNTPSLAVFGPTNPTLYLKHYPLARYLWSSDVSGKPCEKTFPCYGLRGRNWWCSGRPKNVAWCAEQVSPELVIDTAYDYINDLRKERFYENRIDFFSCDDGSLFYVTDPRVNLSSLHSIQASAQIGKDARKPVSVGRFPCQTEATP